MSSTRSLILVLLQIQLVKVQGLDHASQKLRRLNEQFQQFRALTQARLDMLALNQKNSSWSLESHVQTLNDHYHHMSQDLEHLKQTTTQETEGLREWSRKLEKKNKRLENRLSSVERNLRENQCHDHTQRPDPNQDLLNLSLEIQSQEEKLAALQVQRDELLVGLKGLQESLKTQVLRVNQLEGRLGEVLQQNEGREVEPSSIVTTQEYYEPRRRRPGRVLDGRTHHRAEGDSHSPAKPHQRHSSSQPKHLKVQKPRPQSHLQEQEEYPDFKPRFADDVSQPDPHQSQVQLQAQTRPYPTQQEQHQSHRSVSYPRVQMQLQVQPPSQRHTKLHKPSRFAWPQHQPKNPTQPKPNGGKQIKGEALQPQVSDFHPQPQSGSYESRAGRWTEEAGEQSHTMMESVIHNLLQLPARHKIPEQSVPKKNATICNVDSMLFFPSASAENYVSFSSTLPDLSEISACLWLRVEDAHVGTLLSYATDDNDNQLVLYGRNSSASSISFLASPFSTSHPSSSSSLSPSYTPASSPSLEFVIGDPVFRHLPMPSLLDSRWHHLCVVWSSIQGRFWHYSDRRLTSSGSNFRKGWEIPGGGAVVLGQEQDTVGGGFHPAEGFVGQMAGFRVWNRVLSPFEVKGVADGKGVPRGVVLDMEDIQEVHGQVQQVACECLEHCV